MEKKSALGDRALTIILCVTAVLLGVLLFCTRAFIEARRDVWDESSVTVMEFWGKYLNEPSLIDQEALLEQYFSCIDKSTIGHDGCSQTLRDFNSVLMQDYYNLKACRLCLARKNYVELMPLNEKGEDAPPRLGFFYTLDGEGKISSYSLSRLQPISSEDSEWGEIWR